MDNVPVSVTQETWDGSHFEGITLNAVREESLVRAGNALEKGYCESKEEQLRKK